MKRLPQSKRERKVDLSAGFMIRAPMLRSIPHLIRPNSLIVYSGEYPIGIVGDDNDVGLGWTWVLHPNGLPITIAGQAGSPQEGVALLSNEWDRQLDRIGLEVGTGRPAPAIVVEQVVEKAFWLKAGESRVGSILLTRAGASPMPRYRWEVGDHPTYENRVGAEDDLEAALVGAQAGWQAWVEWAGLRGK